MDIYLGYFHLLSLANNATMNTGMCTSLWDPALSSLRCISGSGIAGKSIFYFLKNIHIFHNRCTMPCLPILYKSSKCSISTWICINCSFDNGHPDEWEWVIWISLMISAVWASPLMLIGQLYIFFGEMSIQIFCLLFHQIVCCYCCLNCTFSLYILHINPHQIYNL